MSESLFKTRLKPLYDKGSFLDLDMDHILHESMRLFEDYAQKMSKQTSRLAWASFLEQTVLFYI